LCGTDSHTGQNYEHRRQLIEDKLIELADVFALDICAYAIMSNHYHVVLYIDKEQADNWNRDEVIERWHRLFSGNLLSQRLVRGETLGKTESKLLEQSVTRKDG